MLDQLNSTLRIRSQSEMGARVPAARDEYYSRLLKLIPGEVAALYTWALAIFNKSTEHMYAASAVCLVLLIVIRAMATKGGRTNKVQWGAVCISAISFVIWAFVLGKPYQGLIPFGPETAAFVMAAWTVLLPAVYKGSRE